jgi:hypothetical protein
MIFMLSNSSEILFENNCCPCRVFNSASDLIKNIYRQGNIDKHVCVTCLSAPQDIISNLLLTLKTHVQGLLMNHCNFIGA